MNEITEIYEGFSTKRMSYSLDTKLNFDKLIEFFQLAKDNGYHEMNVTSFTIDCIKNLNEKEITIERIKHAEKIIKNNQKYLIDLKSKL